MYIIMNEKYRRQKEQFNLKECCEDCEHHCSERRSCEMGYPVTPHLRANFEKAETGERIYFCKMFEAL